MLKKLYQFQAQAFPKVFSSNQPFFRLKDEAPNRILSTENEYERAVFGQFIEIAVNCRFVYIKPMLF